MRLSGICVYKHEATASLDRESALGILHTLEKLQAQGKTLVIATHDELLKQLKGQTIAVHACKAPEDKQEESPSQRKLSTIPLR